MSVRARRVGRLPFAVAAIACAGLAISVVQVIGGGADARTLSTTPCVTVSNPLGAATGWTEFIETDGDRNAESEGAMAYGGNLTSPSMTVAKFLTVADADQVTFSVAGTNGGPYNVEAGSAYVSPPNQDVNFNGGGHYVTTNPIDVPGAFPQLKALSATWAAAPVTGTVSTSGGVPNNYLVLTGTNTDLNVFSISQADIGPAQAGVRINVPPGSTTTINVTGPSITFGPSTQKIEVWTGSGWSQMSDGTVGNYTGTIWNFPTATTVNLNNGGAFGPSVLAPYAHVIVGEAAHTIGQMIAKQFSSQRETHLPLFTGSCIPGTPPPPGNSNVKITKTASDSTPDGGDLVTYNLLVENDSDTPATGVVVTDVLPAGVTFDSASAPCTQLSGTVTCNIGNLGAHGSTSLWIKVVANPVAGAGPVSHPQAYHWLTPYKVEQQVDLEAGEQKSVTLNCGAGDILSDGQFRIDHVDQDTGTIADDVTILSSQLNGLGVGSWKGVIRNDAIGRAQAKAFIVCLPKETEAADRQTGYNDSHKHPLSADPVPLTQTTTYAVGRQSATLTCPTGTIPIAPGFDAPSGDVVLAGSEYDPAHPRDWVFTLDVAEPLTTVTLSARCLRTTVGQVYGHTHELRFTHIVKTFTVPGHTAKEGDEYQVICPDDAKGVVATWYLPPGLKHFGNDPRLKERAFRIFNDTGDAKQVTLDLLCLHDRTKTEGMGTTDPVVVPNIASVTSVSADADLTNNTSTATITVAPGSATTGLGGSGLVAGSGFSLKVVSSMPGKGAVTVSSGGTVLARGQVALKPGTSSVARLKLTAAGSRQLAKLDRVQVSVDPTRGKSTTRSVAVKH